MRNPLIAAFAVILLALGACTERPGDTETIGTLGGAAAGAVLGSQIGEGTGRTVATAVGTVVGALAGREFSRWLDRRDQERAAAAERRALAQNEPITWANPERGYRGTVEPVRTFENERGQICREYTHTIIVEGQAETARGIACRQPDGTWQVVA